MTVKLESRLIDDLNAWGCSRETLRKRIRRAASSDMTSEEIAQVLGCNPATVERYRKKGG